MSQMSADPLPAGTEQLALVAALPQSSHDASASRLGMPAVLLENEGKLLPNELRARDAALAGRAGEQPIVLRVKGDGGRLLSRECHKSNMTEPGSVSKPS